MTQANRRTKINAPMTSATSAPVVSPVTHERKTHTTLTTALGHTKVLNIL